MTPVDASLEISKSVHPKSKRYSDRRRESKSKENVNSNRNKDDIDRKNDAVDAMSQDLSHILHLKDDVTNQRGDLGGTQAEKRDKDKGKFSKGRDYYGSEERKEKSDVDKRKNKVEFYFSVI